MAEARAQPNAQGAEDPEPGRAGAGDVPPLPRTAAPDWRLLVIAGAAIGVIPPLIVQHLRPGALFPTDVPGVDIALLWRLVAAMIGRSSSPRHSASRRPGSPLVGNAVTGDLRVRACSIICRRWSWGSFTHEDRRDPVASAERRRRRLWEASPRIPSRASCNVVTVISALVAMILIDWRPHPHRRLPHADPGSCSGASSGARARIAGQTQESLSELTTITQETLSVSGIPLVEGRSTPAHRVDGATARRTPTRCACRCSGR